MSINFGSIKAGNIFFGSKGVASIYFGSKLAWQKNTKILVMGNDRYVCIEFESPDTYISSSQNPVTISVFMNTNEYTDQNPPMWIIDDAGVVVGFSSNGIVGAQETKYGCTGYKRTNIFTDNQLYLNEGKTYYACYKITQWDQGNNYFAYFNNVLGNYKLYDGLGNTSKNPTNLAQYNYIGELSAFEDVIDANENDLFEWKGIEKCGLVPNAEYARKSDALSNYVPELNYGSTDKYEVLNHILMMDKGSGQYGGAGDKFVITESYTDGPIGVISRTSNYTSHVFIPPSSGFFHRNADAYKYIFDSNVNLTENKALVWGNDYIYTNGTCYSRGSQYLGYSCYESRKSNYIDSPVDIANVNTNELFYIDDNVKDKFNTDKGLKLFGNVSFDVVVESPGALDTDAPKVFATIATEWNNNHATVLLVGSVWWPFGNKHTYQKSGTWNNKITSNTPLTVEPSNPQTNDVYYKASNTTWGSVTNECIIKWNGTSWEIIRTDQYRNYETDTDVSQTLFSNANTNGILNEFQPSQLYQTENISSLLTSFNRDSSFVNSTLHTDKKHYIELNGIEV